MVFASLRHRPRRWTLVFASLRLKPEALRSLKLPSRRKTLSLHPNCPRAFGRWPKVASQQQPLEVVVHPWRGDDFDFFSRSATLRASTDRFAVHRGLSLFSTPAKQWTRHRGIVRGLMCHPRFPVRKSDIALPRAIPPREFWRGKTNFSCPPSYISGGYQAGDGTLPCFTLLLCLFISVLAPLPSFAPRRTRLVLQRLRRRASSCLPPSLVRRGQNLVETPVDQWTRHRGVISELITNLKGLTFFLRHGE